MPEYSPKEIGSIISTLRNSRGYTCEILARMIPVTAQTITSIERGKNIPYQRTIRRLAEIFPEAAEAIKSYKRKALKPTKPGSFGAFLRDMRFDRDLSGPELSEVTDIEQTILSSYELNKSLPSMSNLQTLMRELGFTPEHPEEVAVNRGNPKRRS